ncbi:Exodeoxyribonuclease III [Dissulfuribacter thermophilus]|uniref:Exodeoxyribonuclease III n=2 Tax=Dissulfuribacter thermophilus TaxID=1156395 RepID=A0A1B9F679_9BACT|nr:Exodeoxyribonuclease III [Dissulfuribacter thermophilus]
MFIATFNANSIRARKDIIQKWLNKTGCNILCIQETKVQDKDFPSKDFQELGYNCYYKGQKSYNGVAILSKEEPNQVSYGIGDGKDSEEDQARIIRASFKDFELINVYVPQGREIDHPNFKKKLEWFRRLLDHLKNHHSPSQPLLILGDFNVAPEERDVYAPEKKKNHVCFHESVRKEFFSLLDWGLFDLFRHFNKEEKQYTFFDYRIPKSVERRLGWRIDHILVTSPVLSQAKNCYIDLEPRTWPKPSDHTFLCAEFEPKLCTSNA